MPCIDATKHRNPIRALPRVGGTVFKAVVVPPWTRQNFLPRVFSIVGTTVYATLPPTPADQIINAGRGNMVHGDMPKDTNCLWTQNTVVIGRFTNADSPYVCFSFTASAEAAEQDFELISEWRRNLPATKPAIESFVESARTMIATPAQIPALDNGQHLPRLQRAELLRDFLKNRRISGLSVTTPDYAMATSVHVRLPDCDPSNQELRKIRNEAETLMDQLLERLFPSNRNRPDATSDYYGYLAWSLR